MYTGPTTSFMVRFAARFRQSEVRLIEDVSEFACLKHYPESHERGHRIAKYECSTRGAHIVNVAIYPANLIEQYNRTDDRGTSCGIGIPVPP
jgi:hypothetical protein